MEHDILEYAAAMECHELHMQADEETGLKAIIAIHSTKLGPALGGCRCIEYPSTHEAAIDAIRLAQGMTYKAAISHLPLGGGKAVLLKPKVISNRTAYFKAVGRFVNSLNGRYITAVDSGTSIEDMDIIATETKHVATTTKTVFSVADPSSLTAFGVLRGMEAAIKHKLNRDTFQDIHVSIQGLGHAGYSLAKQLYEAGARLSVYDINANVLERAKTELRATIMPNLESLLTLKCDVFAPSALGAILNDQTIPHLKTSIVAGCANNQLEDPSHGEALMRRGILYAPDYVVNAGGLIYVAAQYDHITEEEAHKKIAAIYDTSMHIFKRADKEKRSTNEIADMIAKERLKNIGVAA
jgi:leucine dehydrogenase